MRLRATSAGVRAHALVRAGPECRVLGVFSHAFSLAQDDGWVLALVSRPRRGPLSLVVPGLKGALGRLRPGQSAHLSSECIELPEPGLVVDLAGAEVWPGVVLPAGPLAGIAARRACVQEAWRLALSVPSRLGWMALLPSLFPGAYGEASLPELCGAENAPTLPGRALGEAAAALRELRQALCGRKMDLACRHAEALVGLGVGLTPSGDDFLTGLLLAFSFAHRAEHPGAEWLSALGPPVARAARSRTTLVAEQQIRLAVLGEADHALGQATVALLWDARPAAAPFSDLLEVGSTSGADLLAGLCFASEMLEMIR